MHDVAARAGVSRATVSKYFNDREGLKADTRARIEQACRDLEYVPDPHAVSLVRGRSRMVGVILPVVNEPFFAEALRAIEVKAKALGMDVIIQCSYNDPAEEAAALMTMRSMKVAGVILTAVASTANLDLLLRLEQEMRIVYMDSYVHEDCNYVMNDNRQSMAMLTRYLLGRGHRPAYLGAPPVAHPSPEERLAGYLDAMAEAGMQPHSCRPARSPPGISKRTHSATCSTGSRAAPGSVTASRRWPAAPTGSRSARCPPAAASAWSRARTWPSSATTTCRSPPICTRR